MIPNKFSRGTFQLPQLNAPVTPINPPVNPMQTTMYPPDSVQNPGGLTGPTTINPERVNNPGFTGPTTAPIERVANPGDLTGPTTMGPFDRVQNPGGLTGPMTTPESAPSWMVPSNTPITPDIYKYEAPGAGLNYNNMMSNPGKYGSNDMQNQLARLAQLEAYAMSRMNPGKSSSKPPIMIE